MKKIVIVVAAFAFVLSAGSVNAFMHEKLQKQLKDAAKQLEQEMQKGQKQPKKQSQQQPGKQGSNSQRKVPLSNEERERQKIISSLTIRLDTKKSCGKGLLAHLSPTWNDAGSGADLDGYFFNPSLPPKSFFWIGGVGAQDENHRMCVTVVRKSASNPKNTPKLLVPPLDWKLVWKDQGSGAEKDGAFWTAVPPSNDFTCLGSIAQLGYEKPNFPNYRCVHKDFVQKVSSSSIIWSDEGSNSDKEVTVLKLPNTGSFIAVKGREKSINWFDLKTAPAVNPDSKTVELALNSYRKKIAEEKKVEEENRKIEEQKKRVAKKLAQEKRRTLLKDDKNKTAVSQLFAGDPKDIVFLTNSRSKNVTRGLSGKIKIISSVARACAIGPTNFTPNSTRFEKETFEQLLNAIKPVKIKHNIKCSGCRVAPCKNLKVEKSEIVVLSRDISSTVSFDTLSILLKNTREGTYGSLHVGDYQGFNAKVQSEKRAVSELAGKRNERQIQIKNGINEGSMTGFGMFELKRAQSNAICIEQGNNQQDIIQILQKDILKNGNGTYWQDRFTKVRISPIRTEVGNLEEVFLLMKTQKCGSFFGKTESIKVLTSALIRDEVTLQILPVLLSSNFVVERRNKMLAAKQESDQERKLSKQKSKAAKKAKIASSGYAPGDIVDTGYFNVRLLSAERVSIIGTGYSKKTPKPGSVFIRIKLELENINTEGRQFGSGTLYAKYKNKEFIIDNPTWIMRKDYITRETINPLEKFTGYTVFSVSDKLDLKNMWFAPPRSKDIRIRLIK